MKGLRSRVSYRDQQKLYCGEVLLFNCCAVAILDTMLHASIVRTIAATRRDMVVRGAAGRQVYVRERLAKGSMFARLPVVSSVFMSM
jgi:hypothetical protein